MASHERHESFPARDREGRDKASSSSFELSWCRDGCTWTDASIPKELDPTWLGDLIGHWEGETLVVDTVGTNGRGRPLNGYVAGAVYSKTDTAPRLPVSDQLHMVERIRVVGGGEYLEDEITVTDLKTYTRSFTVEALLATSRRPRLARIRLRRQPPTRRRRPHRERSMSVSRRVVPLFAVLAVASSAWAHHSFAMFDLDKEVTLEGAVKDVQWANPHVWLEVDVADGNGGTTKWSFEMGTHRDADPRGLEEQHAQGGRQRSKSSAIR